MKLPLIAENSHSAKKGRLRGANFPDARLMRKDFGLVLVMAAALAPDFSMPATKAAAAINAAEAASGSRGRFFSGGAVDGTHNTGAESNLTPVA